MSEYCDWKITLAFNVQPGDNGGTMTEALFDAAVLHAPSQAEGLSARADTREGKVWITFTLVDASRGLAEGVLRQMRTRVHEAVLSEDESCVTAS